VLSACGSELEQEFAFGAVRQLFEPLLADPAERERLAAAALAAARGPYSWDAIGARTLDLYRRLGAG
jgi:glycosyltransferase involved in cell wall biosynthesis